MAHPLTPIINRLRIVVTGGAGFLGSYICHELARAHHVVVYDNLSTGRVENLAGAPVEIMHGDVTDELAVERAVAGADVVVHLAAVSSVPASIAVPHVIHHVNATGTLNVLQAARRVGNGKFGCHVILASSAAVYGNQVGTLSEDTATAPLSPYGASKVAAEALVQAFHHAYELPTLVFRIFNAYGPGQRVPVTGQGPAVATFCEAAARGNQPLYVHGTGHQARSFVYAGVIARAVALAVQRRIVASTPVNLANPVGGATKIRDLAELVADVSGRQQTIALTPERPGDLPVSIADVSRLRAIFPDLPEVTMRAGVEATYRWLREKVKVPEGDGPC